MPLLVDTVYWGSKDSLIQQVLGEIREETVLKPRSKVSSNNLKRERDRLILAMQNRGYYDFSEKYILIEVDTVNAPKIKAKKRKIFGGMLEQGEPRVQIYLEVLPYSDTSILHPQYKIGNVYIIPNEYLLKPHQERTIKKDSVFVVERTLKKRSKKVKVKTVLIHHRNDLLPEDKIVHIILRKMVKNKDGGTANQKEKEKTYFILDKAISRAIKVEPGDLYSYSAYQESLQEINNLAIFASREIRFVPSSNGQKGYLDCVVKMQPGEKQVWGADFEVNNSESTVSSIGLSTNLFYRNKNIFKGAEVFEVSVQGGVDFRVDSASLNSNTSELFFNLIDINAETSLYFPRFLGLKFLEKLFKMENARTRVALGYRYLQQSTNFKISSFYTKMGYEWTKGLQHSFMWNPALINLTLEPELDADFSTILAVNNRPLFESLSASSLIPSMDFSYTFSAQEPQIKGGAWFFKSYFEVAGNLVYLVDLAANLGPKPFFGVDYSQYFRTDFDIRYSFKINKRHSVISRLMLGVIIPYGNSEGVEVPFTKRFALGGPSSMRAWNLRYLGPGDQPTVTGAEFQLGDLRIEFNSEYRFMFNSWIGGALFADIGNVWLLNSTSTVSGLPANNPKRGVFTEKFYEQLAIGVGLGLRVDVSFFIFRLDFAVQLRDPQGYNLKNDGTVQYWNFEPFVLENRHKFIIAIGYPF